MIEKDTGFFQPGVCILLGADYPKRVFYESGFTTDKHG